MTFSCLSAATSAGMVPRIAVRTAPPSANEGLCLWREGWANHFSVHTTYQKGIMNEFVAVGHKLRN